MSVHHINWAEEELLLVGYKKFDAENEETLVQACLYEQEECVELNEIVAFFDVENRKHQFYSSYLPDWYVVMILVSTRQH